MEKFNFRICGITHEVMNQGWIVRNGEMYIKYEEDMLDWCEQNGYLGYQSAYENDVIDWADFTDQNN